MSCQVRCTGCEAGTGTATAGGVKGATGVGDEAGTGSITKGLAGASARFTAEDAVGKESVT